MRVLFIGDVVGISGQTAIKQFLPLIKQYYRPQLTIANGENIADGRGITEKLYKWLLAQGIDCVTLGNHAWDNREIHQFIASATCLVRPLNLPSKTVGKGVHYIRINQSEVAIVNVLGNVFMGASQDVFQVLDAQLEGIRKRTPLILVDVHAEATSEKQAIAHFLDGRVSAVLGTHTHVQTADARILPKGTAYVTDVGMTGAMDGIIGFRKEDVIQRFVTQMPTRLEQKISDDVALSGAVVDLDCKTGRALKITSLYITRQTVAQLSK
ncbi:TIGR00282 family metallophosphoesterase [Aerococcaceae bacterium NML190073]|nr:TIGR00282 family metallophosphoesterase [Aerococcaceae bacterium NML190073]